MYYPLILLLLLPLAPGGVGEPEEEGEVEDGEELEDGEISDEDEALKTERLEPKPVCRFFSKGQCTWGQVILSAIYFYCVTSFPPELQVPPPRSARQR